MSTPRTPIGAPNYEYLLEQLVEARIQILAQHAQLEALREDSQQQVDQLWNDNYPLHQTMLQMQATLTNFTTQAQAQAPAPIPPPRFLNPTSRAPEPIIGLLDKFNGNCRLYRGFINQVKLVFRGHPHRYPTDQAKITLIGTLLTGSALIWFNPLLEDNDPLLDDYTDFLTKVETVFSDPDKYATTINRLATLKQGN